jgi:hypothetical protein
LRDRKLFPLLEKVVEANPQRGRQLLGVVVLFGLLLNLLRNVGQLRLLKKLGKTFESLPVLTHLNHLALQ